MTVATSYPGVYISEDASLNLSVAHTPTAVPAFIHNESSPAGILRLTAWTEIAQQSPGVNPGNSLYNALRLWFNLSGGICYIVKENSIDNVDTYDDITLLVANGTTALQGKINTLCHAGSGRFALLDGPNKQLTSADDATAMPDTPDAAAWYPWLKATVNNQSVDIAPSVAAAIAIAQTDRSRGVWKAPANVVLNGLTPAFPVSDDLQGLLNQGKALNVIRDFSGSGTTVYGARTLHDDDNWRYISVRRLFTSIEKDIARTLRSAVFEPNTQPTWQRVKAAIDNYLHSLWQQGALAGDKPADAWFVQIGKGVTMSDDEIAQGKMIVNIGVAAVRPAEFIVIQLSQNIAQ